MMKILLVHIMDNAQKINDITLNNGGARSAKIGVYPNFFVNPPQNNFKHGCDI
jgi:hypothetical protein